MTPLARRHPGFSRKHHRKVVTVLKATTHRNLTNHQLAMLQQILSVADPHLSKILVDGHSCLAAKLLTQYALAALLPLTEFIQFKGMLMAAGQRSDQLIQQCLTGGGRELSVA